MKSSHRKHLKIGFAVVLVLLALTVLVLYFIFRPRRPAVEPSPVSLLHFSLSESPKVALSAAIGVEVFVTNPNFAPFRYGRTAVAVLYREECVGEGVVEAGFIEKRSAKHIGTAVELMVEKVAANPKFLPDVLTEVLYLTAVSRTEGQAIVLGFLKLRATITVECSIAIYVTTAEIFSHCVSDIKI